MMMCSNVWLMVFLFIGTYSQNDISFDVATNSLQWTWSQNSCPDYFRVRRYIFSSLLIHRQNRSFNGADDVIFDAQKYQYKLKVNWTHSHSTTYKVTIAACRNETSASHSYCDYPNEYQYCTDPRKPLLRLPTLEKCENTSCYIKILQIMNATIKETRMIIDVTIKTGIRSEESNVSNVFNCDSDLLKNESSSKRIRETRSHNSNSFDNISVNIGDIRRRILTSTKDTHASNSLCDYEINIIAVNIYRNKTNCSDSKLVNQTCDRASSDPLNYTSASSLTSSSSSSLTSSPSSSIRTSSSSTSTSSSSFILTSPPSSILISSPVANLTSSSSSNLMLSPYFLGISIALLFIMIVFAILIRLIRIRYYYSKCWYRKRQDKLTQDTELPLIHINSTRTLDLTMKSSKIMTLSAFRDLLHLCTENSEVLEIEYRATVAQIKEKKICGSEYTDKNRYNNILPYQDTNVKLKQIGEDVHSRYINANFVEGYSKEIKYIATQDPLPNTSEDFWRMTWEQDVNTIVMLTHFVENKQTKCHRYWNEFGTLIFGAFKVNLVNVIEFIDYDIRDFLIYSNNEVKMVTHYHFKTWPDKGIPRAHFTFSNFLLSLRSRMNIKLPIVVHCSAGIGPTGVYILCDYLLDMVEKEQTVDFVNALLHIRKFRMNVVHYAVQYKFAYCVINEYLMKRNVRLKANDLLQNYDAYISDAELLRMMQHIKEESYWHNILYNKVTHIGWEHNQHKQRSSREPRSCGTFIALQKYPITENESYYIDALMIPDQRLTKQFIATSHPYDHTIGDFWRLVEEYETNVILSLHEVDLSNHENVLFWPTAGKPLKPVDYIHINFVSVEDRIGHNVITLEVNNLEKSEATRTRTVYLLDFKTWPCNGLPQVENFLRYYEDYDAISKHISKDISIFTCSDGTGGNGVFLSFVYILETLLHEKIFDVRCCISTLRLYRDEYLRDMKQLKFIYKCVYNILQQKTS